MKKYIFFAFFCSCIGLNQAQIPKDIEIPLSAYLNYIKSPKTPGAFGYFDNIHSEFNDFGAKRVYETKIPMEIIKNKTLTLSDIEIDDVLSGMEEYPFREGGSGLFYFVILKYKLKEKIEGVDFVKNCLVFAKDKKTNSFKLIDFYPSRDISFIY